MNTQATSAMSHTHTTYEAAMKQLKRNKRNNDTTLVTWDAGSGWTAEGYYCTWRKRIVQQTRKDGIIVI